jgi:hypothetical protein
MYWVIIGINLVLLLLSIGFFSSDKQDNGGTKARTVVGTLLVLLLSGTLATLIGMVVGP